MDSPRNKESSTLTPSPSPPPSMPVKRAARTYGRPKDVVDDASRGLSHSESGLPPTTSAYDALAPRFAPKLGGGRSRARHSPKPDVAGKHGSDDDDDEAGDASNTFQFGWKAKLKQMDEDSDVQDEESPSRDTHDALRTVPNSPRPDAFGGSLSTLTASSELFETTSPLPVARRRRGHVVESSDDSGDETKSSAQKSLHPITSPKSRPSSTPPTSDDEMPAPARLVSEARSSKGKGKASSSRVQIPALSFEKAPAAKKRSSRNKAPTQKELKETIRDRGRIAGAQRAAVQTTQVAGHYNLSNLFQKLQDPKLPEVARTSSFDPIVSFSSPRDHRTALHSIPPADDNDNEGVLVAPSSQPPITQPFTAADIPMLDNYDSGEDEDLPDVGGLLQETKQEEKKRELMERKLKLVAAAKAQGPAFAFADDDDDDELEIVKEEKKAVGGSASKQRPSEGRKRQLHLGGISVAQQQQRAKQTKTPTKALGDMKQDELKRHMAKRVAEQNAEITKQKEDEWKKRGGAVMEMGDASEMKARRESTLKDLLEKGEMNAVRREGRMQVDLDDDEEDDADDEDWKEEASGDEEDAEDADTTMVNEEEEEQDENAAPVYHRGSRRIIDSDSENDEDMVPARRAILGPDDDLVSPTDGPGVNSTSSLDEDDKENSARLMYDGSDDKENKAVPRHSSGARPGLGRQGSSLFGLAQGLERALSMSPGDREDIQMSDDENENSNPNNANVNNGDRRRPLQNLLADDPFSEPGPSSSSDDFAARLQQTSGSEPMLSPTSTLQPSFEAGLRFGSKAAFSQFSDDDDEQSGFKGAGLEPGFSDLFEGGTAVAKQDKPKPGGLFAQARGKTLGLTQDVDLQPAFQVNDRLKRQADEVFEKEQEFVWEVANENSNTETKRELYVNDHGFLTQTRPEGEDAEVYKPSFSFSATQQSQIQTQVLEPPSVLRQPLSTLSMSDIGDPEPSPLRRLVKRGRTPASPESPVVARPRNAFDVLQQKPKAPRAKKQMHEKSVFVAEEAQESDDDEMLGFGKTGDDGEEEEGEDMDRTLTTLVDDRKMDQATLAEDRVLEKFQEHVHEDDLENEKLHNAVVQGELRKKTRRRMLDDSDDEDDSDDGRHRKIRRGINSNAPRIGAEVTEYGKHPETKAFYDTYQDDLNGNENAEFAYLQGTQVEPKDEEMGSDDEEKPPAITRSELNEQLREVARQGEDVPEMDVNDVSWMDQDDSDGEQTKQKMVERRRGQQTRVLPHEHSRLEGWAKSERHSRNAGTGRTSGRMAVTGSRAKSGGGSLRSGVPTAKPVDGTRRPVQVQPSVLAGVASERSSRFGP
ncbi:hypothetical protein FB45DRAFT_903108 [Roridomyces roridus]|uniref:DNA replication checkpoint mediator MRC1 domain-containing protein n=1 Tax=Roridomyces roridus TaxID=1738132 RepID=A0AAD7C3W9_9AGAR|nr:hypothetical protein FB45DRAFT_903108 [Roridomyces roridus]